MKKKIQNFRRKYKILEKSAMILIFPQKFKKKLWKFYKFIWQSAGDVLNNFYELEYFLAARLLGYTIISTSAAGHP